MTVRAWTLEIDGKPAAIAGVYRMGGHLVAFSDMAPGVPKMTVWRCAKAFLDVVGQPMVCLAQRGSERFLERLGWTIVGTTGDGDIYEWRNSSRR